MSKTNLTGGGGGTRMYPLPNIKEKNLSLLIFLPESVDSVEDWNWLDINVSDSVSGINMQRQVIRLCI